MPLHVSRATTRMIHSGGGKLVQLCALAMATLLLVISVVVWHKLEQQDRTIGRAQLTGVIMSQLERLLRGLNEVALTEGTKSSREVVETALGDITALRAQLEGERIDKTGNIDWIDLSPRVSAFVKLDRIGPDNVEAMIQLGKLTTEIGQLQRILEAEETMQLLAASTSKRQTRLLLLGACIVVLAGTLLIFALLHHRVTRPLRGAIQAASAYARGDLTHRLDPRGAGEVTSLLVSLEGMRTELARLVTQVSASTGNVAAAAAKVRATSEGLTNRIQSEAGGVEETAASIRVFAETLQQTSSDTQRAKELTDRSAQAARQAAEIVTQAVAVMDGIGVDSRKISEISGMIDELALQTNLLALNASIESARSGEAGRGFAVVANEVRVLAQRSAAASGEIKQLIAAAVNSVEQGIDLVHTAGDSMQKIAEGNERVAQLIGSVALHATEQAACVEQIKTTIVALDQSTQANIRQVQDAANAANWLNQQSEQLRDQVGRFSLPQA